jgi:Rhodopirellula transposase DDE domain
MTDVDIRDLHGIYDVGRNTGMVMVGTTRETPAFAVDAIDGWQRNRGSKDDPGAERLITADER